MDGMRRQRALGALELAIGLGMLGGFAILLAVPALARMAVDLAWGLRNPGLLPRFGLHPHWAAEAQYAPSLVILVACAALALCYRWLMSRRRE